MTARPAVRLGVPVVVAHAVVTVSHGLPHAAVPVWLAPYQYAFGPC